jgi:hypothetical protein
MDQINTLNNSNYTIILKKTLAKYLPRESLNREVTSERFNYRQAGNKHFKPSLESRSDIIKYPNIL